mmetsp:Transcript_22924/g.53650  ORF Transcript_22924/g.53650 Transcript_22924/m.53650 type:complete len:398 (-) Transcript_22924:231-1424(-)
MVSPRLEQHGPRSSRSTRATILHQSLLLAAALCAALCLPSVLQAPALAMPSKSGAARTVCVTGASGFVGSWVTKELLDHGYTVHATVRKMGSEASKHLTVENLSPGTDPSKLKLFEADLLSEGSFDAAFSGCSCVMHTASPFSIQGQEDPQKAFVDPALKGTTNVLNACTRAGVDTVVLTSSVAAVNGKTMKGKTYNEQDWNEESSLTKDPYSFSKTVAERKAWELAKDAPWKLRTINPALVIGPLLSDRANEGSVGFMKNMVSGTWVVGAEFLLGLVDVRDVAKAHRGAMEVASAEGRHIVCEDVYSIPEMSEKLKGNKNAAKFKLACSVATLPKLLLYALGWTFGLSFSQIRTIGWRYKLDGSKAAKTFDIQYRPAEGMLNDMMDDMVERGIVEV